MRGWDADGEPVVVQKGRNADGTGVVIDTAYDGLYVVLQESRLTDCVAAVVRHWDGERLGLARLVAAYSTALRLALAQLPARQVRAAAAEVGHWGQAEGKEVEAAAAGSAEEQQQTSLEYRERRKLEKALREIADLERQQAGGEILRGNQAAKVAKKAGFLRRLAELAEELGP